MKQASRSSVYGSDQRWRALATLAVAVFISILDLFETAKYAEFA